MNARRVRRRRVVVTVFGAPVFKLVPFSSGFLCSDPTRFQVVTNVYVIVDIFDRTKNI